MGIHEWARARLEQTLSEASVAGVDPALALRALLSAVVECSQRMRTVEDLAGELQFLADNLDADRDYAFMRP